MLQTFACFQFIIFMAGLCIPTVTNCATSAHLAQATLISEIDHFSLKYREEQQGLVFHCSFLLTMASSGFPVGGAFASGGVASGPGPSRPKPWPAQQRVLNAATRRTGTPPSTPRRRTASMNKSPLQSRQRERERDRERETER